MSFFRSIYRDLRHILYIALPHPTARTLLFTLVILFFLSLSYSNTSLSRSIRLEEENIRQWFWYLITEEKKQVLPIAILDLYTSESSIKSEEFYEAYYNSFHLPQHLNIFCQIEAKKFVFLSFFIDETTWIGRYLQQSPKALTRLKEELECFENIIIPIQENLGQTDFYPPVSLGEKLKYVHVNTEENRLYEVKRTFSTNRGEETYPFAAIAMSQLVSPKLFLKETDYPQGKLPIQLAYHPSSFLRFKNEEMDRYGKEENLLTLEEKKDWFQNPVGVLIGFTHDDTQGQLYTILSIAASLSKGETPLYPIHKRPFIFLVISGVLIWGFLEIGRQFSSRNARYRFLGILGLLYLGSNLTAFLFQIYLPIFLPLIGVLGIVILSNTFSSKEALLLENLKERVREEEKEEVVREEKKFEKAREMEPQEEKNIEAGFDEKPEEPPIISKNEFSTEPSPKEKQKVKSLEKQEISQELSFHSGKRLSLARNLRGFNQETILDEDYFPFIDVRTLRRWESGGVPKKRIKEVAHFFKLEVKVFLDPDLSKNQFQDLLLQKGKN